MALNLNISVRSFGRKEVGLLALVEGSHILPENKHAEPISDYMANNGVPQSIHMVGNFLQLISKTSVNSTRSIPDKSMVTRICKVT